MSAMRRLAYLEALEIPVWIGRGPEAGDDMPAGARLRLGPGAGGILIVCDNREAPGTVIASDIARALSEAPVWSWPAPDGDGQPLAVAVEEHLFTRLLVLGEALARTLFGASAPDRIGQARLIVADDLHTLAALPEARRRLWERLCRSGLVSAG